jgi:hypothetical protein
MPPVAPVDAVLTLASVLPALAASRSASFSALLSEPVIAFASLSAPGDSFFSSASAFATLISTSKPMT